MPVPRHWYHKRKYLQGKRGFEKQPFKLPEFIAQTGIAEVRESVAEDDEKKKNKQRARERVQPKMGRVDIDYQVLHDAFFRFQTKPKLTQLGDLYVVSTLIICVVERQWSYIGTDFDLAGTMKERNLK